MMKRYHIILLLIFCFTGCVTRSMVIETSPPGAMVYVDDEPVGESPVTVPFTYYGTHKITIEKFDDQNRRLYERKVVFEEIKAPYYQHFPIDFFADVVWPLKIEDTHVLSYQLEKLRPQTKKDLQKDLFKNAEELRQKAFTPTPD